MEVLTRLSAEHETLRALLEGIASAAEAQDSAALTSRLETARAALTDDLDAHIAVEEAEAFAAISQTLGEDLVLPFCEEHVEIRALRDEIYERLARGEAPYGSSLRLCDLILAHQQREDMMLFPSAREALVQ
jgi:hemerythrin-like domain-containing protein